MHLMLKIKENSTRERVKALIEKSRKISRNGFGDVIEYISLDTMNIIDLEFEEFSGKIPKTEEVYTKKVSEKIKEMVKDINQKGSASEYEKGYLQTLIDIRAGKFQ